MLKKLIVVSIIIGCAFVWAQDLSRPDVNVRKDDVGNVQSKPNIGVVKVEEIKSAEDPRTADPRMNFQGYLTDNSGHPVNGNVTVRFMIYNSNSGGTLLWAETLTVACDSGLFNEVLGYVHSIPASVFTSGYARWMELHINGQNMGRIHITSAGFAYAATKADTGAYAYNSDRLDGHHWSEVPNSSDYIDEGQTAGGDLYGTYPNPYVDGLRGKAVSPNSPTAGFVLKWYNNAWTPRPDDVGNISISQGTGIICSPNPITSTGTVSFNSSWGDSRYINEGQSAGGDLSGTYPNPNVDHATYAENSDRVDGFNANLNGGPLTIVPCNANGRFIVDAGVGPAIRGIGPIGVDGQGNPGVTGYGGQIGVYGNGSSYGIYCSGDFGCSGTKYFIQPHPYELNKEIAYACLEGGESGTYCRGTAQLTNGAAIVNLPEHFGLVTSDDAITVQITPLGECKGLYVESKSTTKIAVKELNAGNSSVKFDYFVQGIRKGYENRPVIRDAQIVNYKKSQY